MDDMDTTDDSPHISKLITAVGEEDVESVTRCLLSGCEQNDIDQALCEVALTGNSTILKLLLHNVAPRANIRYSDGHNQRAIHHACVGGNVEVVKLLYAAGSAIHAADNLGQHPLHIAAKMGHLDIVRYLLSKSAHINSSKTFDVQATPLHVAVEAHQFSCVRELIDSGRANLNVRTSRHDGGHTPLHKAVMCKFIEGVRLLCERGADVDARSTTTGKSPLHFAAEIDELEFTLCLLQAGAEVDVRSSRGQTSLMAASFSNKPDNVTALIEYGADVNYINDESGLNPVHAALAVQADKVLSILVGAGADPNAHSVRQEHPLLTAASVGNSECVRLLLDAGADIDVRTRRDATVMHRCQRIQRGEGRDAVVNLLIERGAQLNVYNQEGYTPFHNCVFQTALNNFSFSTLKLLVMAGARVDLGKHCNKKIGRSGLFRNSPLCWLAWNNYILSADYLVRSDWYLFDENWMYLPGKTPEHNKLNEKIRYLSMQPFSLTSCCRLTVRDQLRQCSEDREILSRIRQLGLPKPIKRFLSLQD